LTLKDQEIGGYPYQVEKSVESPISKYAA